MTKAKSAMLICIASVCLLLIIGFLIVGIAEYADERRGGANTNESSPPGEIDESNIADAPTDEPTTDMPTEPQTEPPTEPPVTEPPIVLPELKMSLTEPSMSLIEGETQTVQLELIPSEGSDASLLAANVSDASIATASISVSDSGTPEMTVAAKAFGTCTIDIAYNGSVLVTVAVSVAEDYNPGTPKPLPPAPVHDDIDPDKPMIALTFDDGPGNYTDELLDILAEYDVRATFLVVGNMIKGREDIIKREIADGHEIGIHTWDHTKLTTLSPSEITEEIDSVRREIRRLTGVTPRIVRPPYGSTNDDVKAVSVAEGFLIVRWNVDPEDWKTRDAQATFDHIMSHAKSGNIILCHDIHKETVESMRLVIPALLEQGYQLVTVSDMLQYSKTEPVPGQIINKQ